MVDINNRGEWKRPLRLDKRIVEYVKSIVIYDAWNNPPTKVFINYQCYYNEDMSTKPTKIHQRKDGTYYVDFEGFRYEVDITMGAKYQWVDRNEDAKKREDKVKKSLYKDGLKDSSELYKVN